jgi:malate dehydrogenase (oxaloacetate-decarboxylating)
MSANTNSVADDGGKPDHSPGNSLTVRLRILDEPGMLGKVTTFIGSKGVDVGAVDGFRLVDGFVERDITVYVSSKKQGEELVVALGKLDGVEVVHASDPVTRMHLGGKIEIALRRPINTRIDLGQAYTPGVAGVCMDIHADTKKAYNLTMKGNTILIVTDGSRVLSLGNIGPEAALPVMEGKAMLFKRFGNVNAVPICLSTQDPEEIIRAVKAIAPAYGGVNLEDIASPGCWDIERRLQAELDIPIFHDDQHGTAVVVLAGTINAAKVVKKQLRNLRVVVSGVGAAGMACSKLLIAAGVRHLVGFKKEGAIYKGRTDMNAEEQWLAEHSNPKNFKGSLREALKDADMFLGLSVAGVIDAEDLKVMRRDPIVFALANPTPEVDPKAAAKYARIVATGSSEYANQINNALVFPGIFRGALDCRVPNITEEMKLEAARSLAAVIPAKSLRDQHIIPGLFDQAAHDAVSQAVARVAHQSGAARRTKRSK